MWGDSAAVADEGPQWHAGRRSELHQQQCCQGNGLGGLQWLWNKKEKFDNQIQYFKNIFKLALAINS